MIFVRNPALPFTIRQLAEAFSPDLLVPIKAFLIYLIVFMLHHKNNTCQLFIFPKAHLLRTKVLFISRARRPLD